MNSWTKIAIPAIAFFAGALQAQTQVGSDIDGELGNDHSGYAVMLSADGRRVAIGAPQNDGNGSSSGHVRVYQWSSGAWTQLGADIDGEAAGDISGESLSLSADGNRLAIGAPLNDGGSLDAGHARVFEWTGSAWAQLGKDIDDTFPNAWSGYVALSPDGSRLAVGSIDYSYEGFFPGHVRVFRWSGEDWTQLGATIEGEANEDNFGYAVSLSGDGSRLAVGGLGNDGRGRNSGHVRVFQWSGSAWNRLGGDIDGEARDDIFGASVALSTDGNRLAVGAPQNDGNGMNSGHVRVFEWNGSAWTQLGADIDGEAADDRHGVSVSLTSDGNLLAVGAPLNHGSGYQSGQARVYRWSGTAWEQHGSDIHGEASGDEFGMAVSLSPDGNWLAVGATGNDGAGHMAGHVRVFTFAALQNQVALNGLFYDPANPGHGFDINVLDSGATMFYYGHTSNGERLWLISDLYTADFEFGVPFEMDMYEVAQGTFGSPVQPAAYWGTIAITLADCDSGSAVLSGIDGEFEMNLERLAGLPGVDCGRAP